MCLFDPLPRGLLTLLSLLPSIRSLALTNRVCVKKQENLPPSRTMLTKFTKQQRLLLQELERTKRRLREEILAREERTANNVTVQPVDHGDPFSSWGNDQGRDSATRPPKNALYSPSRFRNGKQSPPLADAMRDSGIRRGARLKRSRSEAGMGNAVEGDRGGAERTRAMNPEENKRSSLECPSKSPSMGIDLLPIMCTTGESALEVGLSGLPVGSKGWHAWPNATSQEPVGQQDQPVHMLPVFRLPEVSNNPVGGFLRRLPREETQRERECRVKEAEELEKMKAVLGLTSTELEALEEELLPGRGRGGNNPAVAAAMRSPGAACSSDSLDLEKHPHEVLYGPDSALTKQQQLGTPSTASRGGKRRRRSGTRRAADAVPTGDKHGRSPPPDDGNNILDRPTPRVLRRTPYSTLAAELTASVALSVKCTGQGKRTGPWTSTGENITGTASGPILGMAITTEQLVAAAADVGMFNLLELRRELGRSVGQVRSLARAVKLDVQEVTRLCPVQHPRAVRFLRRWACERLATLADEIVFSRAAAALERWRHAVAAAKTGERREAYLRYQGSNKLLFALDKAYLRRLARGWVRWGAFLEAERARQRRILEGLAAITIQRAVRGFHARRLRAWLTLVARDRQRHLAAVTLTRHAKGKVARMRYARVKAGIERVRAGELLRRVGCGMLGRKKAKRIRQERARLKVALGLQALFRGRVGRRLFLSITKARRERLAATKIQAVTRGNWGRQQAESLVRKIQEDAAAGKIQRAARAWLARRLVQRMREHELASRTIRSIAALNIQRVYRGHRTRILHGARLEIQRSRMHGEDEAATKIQALVRAHLSKRIVAKLSKKRNEQRISDARLWTETWSEDAQMWFYHNATTGEALWEPPSTGYTKNDGALVLASGQVVTDPEQGMTEEERVEARKQSSCVECEQKRSTRKCDQCGDGFCTRCFRKTHASGRRTKHTWVHVGPMECAECESEVAIKWCTACDDPFCAPCWSAIHSRGKRSLHSHCTISPGGRVSTKAIAPDGTDAGMFTPGENLVAETAGAGGYGGGGAAAIGQGYESTAAAAAAAAAAAPLVEVDSGSMEWQEYADDEGNPYWYNAVTGASQYENPFGGAVWTGGSITTADSTVAYGGVEVGDGHEWQIGQQVELGYVDAGSGAMVTAQGSAGEWSEHVDDDGNTYFYSSVTGESQYEPPY